MKKEAIDINLSERIPTSPTAILFDERLQKGVEEAEQILRNNCEHQQELIRQTLSHSILSGGKRLRSKFILTSWLIFNENLNRDIVDVAAAAELFHTATLLHDDVLDDANLRRGRETINTKWGTRHAVLLGDFLLSRTFRLLQNVGSLRVMESFVEAALDLGDGALTEHIHRDDIHLSEELYFYIITRKTASFFRACAQAGAILAKASEEDISALKDFGINYGIAFQITDDLIDVISDESTMGKPRGKDILEGHLTLPLIKYFEKNKNNIPKIKLSELTPYDDEFKHLMDGLSNDGAISYAYSKAESYKNKALDALNHLPSNDATDYFKRLTIELIKRKA